MKQIILILTLIILCSFVYGVGEHNLLSIEYCEGYVDVFDKTKNKLDYNFIHCARNNDDWICDCNKAPFNLTFTYNETIVKEYDFIVRYYIDKPFKGDNERIYSHEGLVLGTVPPPPPFRFTFPSFENNSGLIIFGIIAVIFMFSIGVIVVLIKKVLKEDVDEEELDRFFEKQRLK